MSYHIIPLPQNVFPREGKAFVLNQTTYITFSSEDGKLKNIAKLLSGYLQIATGIKLSVSANKQTSNAIVLKTGFKHENKEAYNLCINSQMIIINGVEESGVFYGAQTLRKSIVFDSKAKLSSFPAVEIIDFPRFTYRGVLLDVARYFFPVEFIKNFIDILALHNINRFHWHLTDDQGWRIEIKKYPKLTSTGSIRKRKHIHLPWDETSNESYGGYYTQKDVKEIVDYAQERFITVIPEVDFPGHTMATLASYPELGCTGGPYVVTAQRGIQDDVLCLGNERTLTFIEDVLLELVELFPSEYIHTGGDECRTVHWKSCPKCQSKIKALQLYPDNEHTAEQKLQHHCTSRMEKFLMSKGRKMIGWDEILKTHIAPTTTIMAWQGVYKGIMAAKMKHPVIMTPTSHVYFDYYQSLDLGNEFPAFPKYLPLEQVYNFEPIPNNLSCEDANWILGAQANLWTGYIPTCQNAEYMLLPRLAALSEVVWSMPEEKNYTFFLSRLLTLAKSYEQLGYHYAKHSLGVTATFKRKHKGLGLWIYLHTPDNSPIYYALDGTDPGSGGAKYTQRIFVNTSTHLKAIAMRSGIATPVYSQRIEFNKATLTPITIETEKCIYQKVYCLTNGMKGSLLFNDENWIKFCNTELDIEIDLKKSIEISSVTVGTLIYLDYWIFAPSMISVMISNHKKKYKIIAKKKFPVPEENISAKRVDLKVSFKKQNAQYIKIHICDVRKIPEWHRGKGCPASLLIDEIGVF